MRRRLSLLASAGALALSGSLAAAVPAQADEPENPSVVCEDANNEIDVNFQGSTASTDTSIYHGCVSVDFPQIVYGEVKPRPGTASGSPSAATINIPGWTVVWYDANDDEVADSQFNVTFTYLGPIPQVMVGTMVATDPLLQAGAGTASRACQTSNLCTYYNTGIILNT
ncbi:MAG TPA: hypothetical protein VN520_19915 [Streptomyces sp.]|uniref:hypothetical protein n=1 Tax=Streptomyces sp. TaxID=1931 RepID=UPI002CA663E9|nr:hypothetical protein [Streptomyces sp.]HWU08614.1 hypothetical protein [Streptomyces sp.]